MVYADYIGKRRPGRENRGHSNRQDSLEITDLRRLLALAWHARGQGFKSPILHSQVPLA